MIQLLRDKKVIFFDVGYTLDRPASGDWMLTNRFLKEAGDQLKASSEADIRKAMEAGLRYLMENHLGLSEKQREDSARDRACNMENYLPYPGIQEVLGTLSKTHRLGVISDTWPSIEQQLECLGISQFLSFQTFSCYLGIFKPDRRMYLDALEKSGVAASEAVFIDDSPRNLEGAAALGITPILIAANPASDVETPYLKIRDLRELIQERYEYIRKNQAREMKT